MIKTEGLKLFSIYYLLLLSQFHTSISPPPIGFIDAAHESATGITDAHDAGAIKSTIELTGERLPHSQPQAQPCRRDLGGCLAGLFRGSGTTERTSQAGIRAGESAEGTRATETFRRPSSWTFSIVSKFRQLQSKVLFGFYPKTRETWNLVHASYEEILASALRSKSGWGDDGTLAANLADLRTARRQSTGRLGLNPVVRQYILKTEIPKLHQDLVNSLDKVFKSLLQDTGVRPEAAYNLPSKIAIINKFFKAELQDPELAPLLEPFKTKLDHLNALHPTSESAVIPRTLSSAELPLKPSFSNLEKLKVEPALDQATRQFWERMNFQFTAEANHLGYLSRIERPVLRGWGTVQRLTNEFSATTRDAAWLRGSFRPERFSIADYRKLKAIGAARRAVIRRATPATKASFYDAVGLDRAEIKVRRRIALEALLIESIGERSDEVREIVQGLVDGGSASAGPYLQQINNYQSGLNLATPPSWTLENLRRSQNLPRRPGPAPSRSAPSTPPPTAQRDLRLEYDDEALAPPDPQNQILEVSYVEGASFDHRSPEAEQQIAQNILLNRIQGH
ncbi:hypothetical protein DFH28DRAFT_959088 [Melampsora americana]|nr:hypothetical protein DFH28DRAFT_959088 [Melampsora americana]